MAYKVVDFNAKKKELVDQRAKGGDDFDGPGFDEDAFRTLTGLVRAAVEVEEDVHKRIGTASGAAKRLIDQAEALVKKKGKKLTQADANLIDVMAKTIEENSDEAEKSSTEANSALGQWRGDVTHGWDAVFSDGKVPAGVMAPRAKTLKFGPADEALRKRMKEYVDRVQNLQKLARQAAGQGGGNAADNLAGDTKKFKDAVTKARDEIARKAPDATKMIRDIVLKQIEADKKKKARPDVAKVKGWEEALAAAEAKAKPVRGQFKSLEVLMATYKKSAAMLQGDAKKNAQKAYEEAGKVFKVAQANLKAMASDQSNGKKAVAFAKKNVKK